jgi:hypothetical protein
MLLFIMIIVLIFLIILINKAFKSKTKNCHFKLSLSLVKGFSIEFSLNKENTPI